VIHSVSLPAQLYTPEPPPPSPHHYDGPIEGPADVMARH